MRGEEELADLGELLDSDGFGGIEHELGHEIREEGEDSEDEEELSSFDRLGVTTPQICNARHAREQQGQPQAGKVPMQETGESSGRVAETLAQSHDVAS